MKLKAVISKDVNSHDVIERTISVEPSKLITEVNNFLGTINRIIKDNIVETVAVTGTAPTNISIRVLGDLSIMDFSKDILLELKCGVVQDIDRILLEISMEMRKELIFEIICTTEFKKQKIKLVSKKKSGD